MRKFLTYVLKNSELIHGLYNWYYRTRNKSSFYEEIERRKTLSIFDYKMLAQPIPFYPIEKQKDSNYYGHALALKKYAGIDKIASSLEHGIFLGNRITREQTFRTIRSVITMSGIREQAFKEHHVEKPIVAIGPYVHYADPLLTKDEYDSLKSELGKVLLVMPVHAGSKQSVSFDNNVLMDFVEKVRKDYDTVMVCLYFREILNAPQLVEDYEKKGYRIVCAGYWYDLNFINRLKSIIMLSDYVVSNKHGTNTGYCTYLGKPQTIVYDKNLVKQLNVYNSETKKVRDAQVKEIEDAFSEYKMEITDYQKSIVDKYWGVSLIKSPHELYDVIKKMNDYEKKNARYL